MRNFFSLKRKVPLEDKPFNQPLNLGSLSVNKTTLWFLLMSQLFAISMVSSQLTLWMLGIIGLCLCWRALMNVQDTAKPSKGVLILLAITGSILLAVTGKQLGLLLSMLHLLCFAYVLKGLELNSRKDIYQLSLLGVFVLASALIFSQSIYFSLLIFCLVVSNFILLNSLFLIGKTNYLAKELTQEIKPKFNLAKLGSKLSSKQAYKQLSNTSILFFQSIPLAIVLFVVFPKLPPFWKVPQAKSASSGLSDTVKIGDIANLAMSDDLAFRVDFNNYSPNYSQLYWRTIVLEHFDGTQWYRDKFDRFNRPIPRNTKNDVLRINDEIIQYDVFAEPTYQHWLYGLDVASSVDNNEAISLPQYTIYSQSLITKTKRFSLRSNLSKTMSLDLSALEKHNNLRYPADANPKLTAEGKRLRNKFNDEQRIINEVLNYFREEAYYYTLQPPLLTNNSLDQFYFETRSGFCEYYASSFTYLMRAAGIPARVVLGYMGGELNPNGGYYSIYQRDAHAWAEVWLNGKGWQRIDPTAAVSPERVESGFSQSLLNEQSSLSESLFSAKTFENFALLNNLRLQFEALDYQWTQWVVGYSAQKQKNFLSQWLGNIKPWKSAAIIGSSLIFIMFILWLFQQLKQTSRLAKIALHQQLYQQISLQLQAKGFIRLPHESVASFAKRFAVELTECSIENLNLNLNQQQNPSLNQKHKLIVESFSNITHYFSQLEYQLLTVEQVINIERLMVTEVKYFKTYVKAL